MFVLDLEANPHPDLLAFGLELRRISRNNPGNLVAQGNHLTFLQTCAKATGCPVEDVAAWLEHWEPTPRPARAVPRD